MTPSQNNGAPLTFSKVLFGVFYGGAVAGAYLFVKVRGHSGGLVLFSMAVAVAFMLHLLAFPKITLLGFKDKKMWIRGVLYACTQVLIFKAQSRGDTSSALVASTLGSVFGVLFGRLFSKSESKD